MRANEAEKLLEQGEKTFKEHDEMMRLLNKDLTRKMEKLEGEVKRLRDENVNLKADSVRHVSEMEEVMADSRTSAAIAVLQARIEMSGEDPSKWDVAGWKEALCRLTGSEAEGSVEEKSPGKGDETKSIVATSPEV